MKPIREIAVVIDNGRYAGFLVGYEEDIIDADKYWYSRLRFVDADSMRMLVKAGTVQYFDWDDNQQDICIKYTDEELADIKRVTGKSGVSLASHSMTLIDYMRNDVVFDIRYVRLAENASAVAASCITRLKVPFLGSTYSLMLYGAGVESKVTSFVEGLDRPQKGLMVVPNVSNNNASVIVHEKLYEKFALELTVLTYINTEKRDVPSGLAGMLYPSTEAMVQAREMIEPINQRIYRTFF